MEAHMIAQGGPAGEEGRGLQGRRLRPRARRGGGLISLWVFPLSTACGTYGLLVYRHPEALDFFEGVFSGVPAAPDLVEARG
jgi:hypothetical protein